MTDDIQESENVYSSNDVAAILKIQDSTLRKYALMLEEQGYKFHKNTQGHRGYFNSDVIAMKKLVEIKKHPDMTLKQACSAVIAWVKDKDKTDVDTEDITPSERHNERFIEEFEDFKRQQETFNKDLLELLKDYIDTSVEQRVTAIMESEKEKLLIATAQEDAQEPKRKKSWFKFWTK